MSSFKESIKFLQNTDIDLQCKITNKRLKILIISFSIREYKQSKASSQ